VLIFAGMNSSLAVHIGWRRESFLIEDEKDAQASAQLLVPGSQFPVHLLGGTTF
jgi:hypothetical protein